MKNQSNMDVAINFENMGTNYPELQKLIDQRKQTLKFTENEQKTRISDKGTQTLNFQNNNLLDYLKAHGNDTEFQNQTLNLDKSAKLNLLIAAIKTKTSPDHVKIIADIAIDKTNSEKDRRNEYRPWIMAICERRNLEALEKIGIDFLDKEDLLKIFIQILLDQDSFENWFDRFIDNDENKKYMISADRHNDLLETAVKARNHAAIIKLCKAGAYIGYKYVHKNKRRCLIDDIDPAVLGEIFDSCLTSNGKTSCELEIYFNYINFVPPHHTAQDKEMTAFNSIVKNSQLLELLQHPLITSFLTFRWAHIAKFFLLEFCMYVFYCLSMVTYILTLSEKYVVASNKYNVCDSIKYYAWCASALGICFLFIREANQFVWYPKKYVITLSNYMEIMLILLSIKTLQIDFNAPDSKTIIVVNVLFMAWELMFLVGYFPILSISTHILMLQEVLKTFLKSFSLYSIFVLTFMLCFRVLFQGENVDSNDKDKKNKFEDPFQSFAKTMAMVAGELDFENLGLESVHSYLFFLLFVICMTVVLMNLLNGLAVSDIQIIKDRAQLNVMLCRTNLLLKSNSQLFKSRLMSKMVCVCPYSLAVQPHNENLPNTVLPRKECRCNGNSQTKEVSSEKKDESSILLNFKNMQQIRDFIQGKCTVMEKNIVKLAIKRIHDTKIREDDDEDNRLKQIEENVKSIEDNINKILPILSEIQKGLNIS